MTIQIREVLKVGKDEVNDAQLFQVTYLDAFNATQEIILAYHHRIWYTTRDNHIDFTGEVLRGVQQQLNGFKHSYEYKKQEREIAQQKIRVQRITKYTNV